jgi:hypothetical protein
MAFILPRSRHHDARQPSMRRLPAIPIGDAAVGVTLITFPEQNVVRTPL